MATTDRLQCFSYFASCLASIGVPFVVSIVNCGSAAAPVKNSERGTVGGIRFVAAAYVCSRRPVLDSLGMGKMTNSALGGRKRSRGDRRSVKT